MFFFNFLQVGDMISVIDMPPPDESIWWRGKRGFEVGFFPCECVEVIGDKVPQGLTLPMGAKLQNNQQQQQRKNSVGSEADDDPACNGGNSPTASSGTGHGLEAASSEPTKRAMLLKTPSAILVPPARASAWSKAVR